MKRTLVKELPEQVGEVVKIQGWVHRIRLLGKIAFLLLRDRSGLVQCVVEMKKTEIKGLKVESVVQIIGQVKEAPVKFGVEVLVQEVQVISAVREDLPLEVNKEDLEASLDFVLNHRVLSLRNRKVNAIFKVQATLAQGFAEFLKGEEFTQVFTPKIVAEGTEGGTDLFELQYFERKAYLAQSPQFYKQMLVGAGYERVFEIGHVYRAEEHNTSRHLNEYVSLDLEMGFIENEEELMELETRMLRYVFHKLQQECASELSLLEVHVPEIGETIPTLRLSEALEILEREYGLGGNSNHGTYGNAGQEKAQRMDLTPEGERLLAEYVQREYGSELVFVTHYPRAKRPMYTMPAEEGLTHSFDLLFRGLEITTGGQRIHEYQQLWESIEGRGMNPESFGDYLETFRFGMPPHGGLAIGLERLTAQLLGFSNVRECTLFPRDRGRLRP